MLVLRDVFDYSVSETADVLELSKANVRTIHLRAHRAISAYEAARSVPPHATQEQHRATSQSIVGVLQARFTRTTLVFSQRVSQEPLLGRVTVRRH